MCSPEVKLLQGRQAGKWSVPAAVRIHAGTTTTGRGPQDLEHHQDDDYVPLKTIDVVPEPPSLMARYTCAAMIVGIFAIWGKIAFVDEKSAFIPGSTFPLHSWKVPAALTTFYLASLPLLHLFSKRFLNSRNVDVKLLLKESMIIYNAGQVALNAWMVYRFLNALCFHNHPFIGGSRNIIETGATYAVWIHYMDKYLEFFDTYFMVLRGRIDQVSFLHVYHHTSIAWAWWFGIKLFPGGDAYFGALLNSWIHVMMYSYYTFSLLKISCPWKRYLTQAQLLQFASVVTYSVIGSTLYLPSGSWREYTAHAIQDFEMISLFVLFLHFYRKAYSNKKDKKIEQAQQKEQDQIKASSSAALSSSSSTSVSSSSSTLLPPLVVLNPSPSSSIATDSDAGSDIVSTEQDSLMDSSDDEETD